MNGYNHFYRNVYIIIHIWDQCFASTPFAFFRFGSVVCVKLLSLYTFFVVFLTIDWPYCGIKTRYSNSWPINQMDQKINNLKEEEEEETEETYSVEWKQRHIITKVDLQLAWKCLKSEISHTITHIHAHKLIRPFVRLMVHGGNEIPKRTNKIPDDNTSIDQYFVFWIIFHIWLCYDLARNWDSNSKHSRPLNLLLFFEIKC